MARKTKIYPCPKCGGINSLNIRQTFEKRLDNSTAIFNAHYCTRCDFEYFFDKKIGEVREVLGEHERRCFDMKFSQMYDIQKKMNKKIFENMDTIYHNQTLLSMDLLELSVEVGELANEIKCFKYWSKKRKKVTRQKVLTEYADVIHALLSVGIRLQLEPQEILNAFIDKQEVNIERQEEGY